MLCEIGPLRVPSDFSRPKVHSEKMCAVAAKSCDSHSGVTTSSSAAYSQEPPNGDWKYQKQAEETM
ncbi:hypothetical protein D3C80_1991100 [compost metagenome]